LDTKFKKVQVNFESGAGSELYGITFDCNTGVAVDNVALRGSSGIEFTKMDKEFLKQHIKKLNIKLLILQFGVNVVPSPAKNYDFYEKLVVKQLRFLKSLSPDLCILVVGVSDMAHKEGTSMVSYRNIPLIRDAQRKAAFQTGCAFWDLYQAMGGAGAMRSWVHSKPSLAGKDYTHFNARGARVVSEMLYEALMKEYENYKEREKGIFP
jgi:lysophospholipase L1-like esterase